MDNYTGTFQVLQDTFEIPTVDFFGRNFLSPITTVQASAGDLYDRGLNVFPIPAPKEVRAMHIARPDKIPNASKKPSYGHDKLFINRMARTADFYNLFELANIAVILGRTSGNLAQIDCDSPDAFKGMYQELSERNIPFWAYTSSNGNGSFLIRVIEGEVNNIPEGDTGFEDVALNGHHRYAVLPPSIHPEWGEVYMWVTPEPITQLTRGESVPYVSIKDIEFLSATLVKTHSKYQNPELVDGIPWTINLSRKNREILNGALGLSEGIRNANLVKPIYDVAACVKEGLVDEDEGLELLEVAAEKCGYSIGSIRQMFHSAIMKPNLSRASDNYVGKDPVWVRAATFAQQHNWEGRTAQSDRVIFLALCERCRMEGKEEFRASKRELEEISGKSSKTVVESLKRLKDQSLIQFVKADAVSGASIYKFTDSSSIYTTNTLVVNSGVIRRTDNELDLFSRNLLAQRIWQYLLTMESADKKQIVADTMIHRKSIDKPLNWLESLGLVRIVENRYYGVPATDEEIGELASGLGKAGRTEKHRVYNDTQRQIRVNRFLDKARRYWQHQIELYEMDNRVYIY